MRFNKYDSELQKDLPKVNRFRGLHLVTFSRFNGLKNNIMITNKTQTMKSLMYDIIVDVSWTNISKKYFGKSRSWLSQKMLGINGNGVETEFSEEEKATLKHALNDLADRIRVCADKI